MYNNWYDTYDNELLRNGYITHIRCAEAINRNASSKQASILDIGCGTGLSGQEILSKGFVKIDGSDFSSKMLEKAAEKNIYQNLFLIDLNTENYNLDKKYDIICAAGVISPNHVKPKTINYFLKNLNKKGLIVFSLNDHAVADENFMKKINFVIKNNKLKIVEKIYGDHLVKIKLRSWIYVLQK